MSFFLLFSTGKSWGQSFWEKSHLGIGVGAMKYRGDIRDPFTRFAFQGNYTYELTDHLDLRAQAFLGSVGASDASVTPVTYDNTSYNRPHPFESRITEASLLVAYNLLNMNEGSKWTPYLFAGIGYFHYNPYQTIYDATTNRYHKQSYYATDKRNKPNIPMGGGIRYGLNDNIRLNLEANFRYTTTNDLDGYNPPKDGKDFFYSFTFGVSFRLGGDYNTRKNSGGKSKSSSRKNCPPVYL
ncbi:MULTISPECIES: DUF6089 family protein [Chitinophagaceae]